MQKRTVVAIFIGIATASSVTDCHAHGSTYFCVNTNGVEGAIVPAPTGTPKSFTGCHNHGSETFCMNGDEEVQFVVSEINSGSVTSTASITSASQTSAGQTTAVTDCHMHGKTQFCVDGKGKEGYILPAPATNAPSSYTGCHSHETDVFCMAGDDEVQFVVEGEALSESSSEEGNGCHFHAGVEHCPGKESKTCSRVDRDYNIPLRIGTLFAILATSTIGVLLPLFFSSVLKMSLDGIILTFLTQFGTGVIISTALVHLITHANLMFANECLDLHYESTATAIVMAGLFLGFLADYGSAKLILERRKSLEGSDISDEEKRSEYGHEVDTPDRTSVLMLEAGIIFHSVIIGVTTVVAGDSFYITLFIVVIFHQAFEGIALGSRIAAITLDPIWKKVLMAMGYAVTTPIGMGIGIGVLKHFNGNNPSTVIAIGTLDALSAGILLWVGLIEMLAHDWLHGPLLQAGILKAGLSMVGLIAGMILMSFLGKWT